jgi:hypothetical protein
MSMVTNLQGNFLTNEENVRHEASKNFKTKKKKEISERPHH